MLRVVFNEREEASWLVTEDELLDHIDQLEMSQFSDAPAGPVEVEATDELNRIQWRALYPNCAALTTLAREIRAGRDAAARRRA